MGDKQINANNDMMKSRIRLKNLLYMNNNKFNELIEWLIILNCLSIYLDETGVHNTGFAGQNSINSLI